ncbi:FMN-binding negative transcriptional regulator [Sphingopyxis fribergensis]|uniref:FMN-binding negative transcriptional regulator n=1 Tax=Sphingopyxis fribergensis TaxID=1515612 RepID=UPI001E59A216|nr:FMN-binding negative transcriptional regulator [Sphingopyxis fribergensis]
MADREFQTGGSVSLFERFDKADVKALIEEFPLAWVSGGPAATLDASLLPLVGVYDADGRLVELIGHMMRSNPLHATLEQDPHGTILFNGPGAYVGPEHAGRRDWAPTWNYAQLKIRAEIGFDDALTEASLQILIDAMEAGRAAPWSIDELGARYRSMLGHIIGFRAIVTSLSGKFKLGQDESGETLHNILDGLPDADTVAWMRRFNQGR